jgi:hypothetical protein
MYIGKSQMYEDVFAFKRQDGMTDGLNHLANIPSFDTFSRKDDK